MKISKEQREKIERELVNTYNENGFDFSYAWNGLGNMIIKDFLDKVEEYEENTILVAIVNDITGNYDGSYNCSTYESAKLIAENIFEFNEIVSKMEKMELEQFEITETEKNLVKALWYICDITILNQNCETLEELVENLS